ncbi:MAG: cellulase family glycosylhydrolase [Anaerolinea sp.]|nr:cellulase family glycosylhydrolase [Anaerolinea sp.]
MKRMILFGIVLCAILISASWRMATAVSQPRPPQPQSLIVNPQSSIAALVPWRCGRWFLSGVNVPWQDGAYGADFGTVEEWGNYHAYDPAATAQMFANLHAAGVNTVRWWVFTDGRGAPEFDSDSGGSVTGLDANFLPSIESAITLAAQHDIYLVFNLWDFGMLDDENPGDGEHAGGHTDLIVEAAKRQSFINNALIPMLNHPIAGAGYTVGTHPNVIAWDIINEPEWGIIESGGVDPDISNPVTLAQMQRFVAEIAAAIRQHSDQLITVGSASLKWNSDTVLGGTANWWADEDLTPFAANGHLDFYQVHYYGWMDGDEVTWSYSPLFQSAADAGLDKPTVIGEMPLNAIGLDVSLAEALDTIYTNGYAGVWLWAYEDDGSGAFGVWPTGQPELSAFNQAHVGETAVTDQCALTDLTLYDDALAPGWQDWSWDSTTDLNQAAIIHSGAAAAAVTFNAPWAGFSLRADAPLDPSPYSHLSFWIYGAVGGGELQLYTQPTDAGAPGPAYTFTPPAATWSEITVPLTTLGSPAAIARINIQDSTGAAQPTFYLDDIRLYNSAPPPPSGGLPDPLADRVLGQLDFDSNSSGSGMDKFDWPSGTAVAPNGALYVVDYRNNRVQRFPSAAAFMAGDAADLSIVSSSPGVPLIGPESVVVDTQGNVYIAETENHRVLIYPPGETTQASVVIGQYGMACPAGQTTFFFPRGLALDSNGRLYVTDQFHYRVLIFTPPFTSGMLASGVIGQPDLTACNPDGGGAVSGSGLNGPRGVALDSGDNLYVADSENNRVLKYAAPLTNGEMATAVLGQPDFTANTAGSGDDQMHFPIDLALDSHDNLYVSDMFNHRVLAFGAGFSSGQAADQTYGTPRQIATNCYDNFPAAPVSQTLFYCPQGLAVDANDNLYLADALHHRVLAFDQPEHMLIYLPILRR